MSNKERSDLATICGKFDIPGSYLSGAACGSGHINDTYVIERDEKAGRRRYVFQRLNNNVFPDLEALMVNITRVLDHQHTKVREGSRLQAMELIHSRDGAAFVVDDEGSYWRAFRFVENATSYDIIPSARHAYYAAQAFGEFQGQLADLPPADLTETIPDFHNTAKRFQRLVGAIDKNTNGRADDCRAEIEFALERAAFAAQVECLLASGEVPKRIAHNDTKLNNVMLDDTTDRGVCVIDLDTVMPGSILYDFGDMVRTGTMPVAEDELDLSKVAMNIDMFKAMAEGYLAGAKDWLTPGEQQNLVLAAKVATLEVGIRFLTDFLEGDRYFKIHRRNHNLDRCRTQLALVASIEKNSAQMDEIIGLAAEPATEEQGPPR